jgi:hypothetical protein
MKAVRRWRPTALLLACLVAWGYAPGSAQSPARYFPETGHYLDPAFAALFDRSGGIDILGYPITEAFVDPQSGRLLQYFENARLETTLEERGPGTPGVSALGEMMGGREPARRRPPALGWMEPGCRYFPEAGHSICHAYLDFYDTHFGEERFGEPISDHRLEGGRLVQYFRGFRLEWLPEVAPAGEVQIAPLGRQHFARSGFDAALLSPVLPLDESQYRVLDLKPELALSQAIAKPQGSQRVLVLVRDQNELPVPGASVTLSAGFPEGLRTFLLPLTDEDGLTQIDLAFEGQPPGSNIELRVWAVYQGLQASTRDSFRIWW